MVYRPVMTMTHEQPIRLTWLPLLKDKLWYRHIFVYKLWRQTCTSVYWCTQDIRQHRGTERTPKQRRTCRLARNRGSFQESYTTDNLTRNNRSLTRAKTSLPVCQTHFLYDLKCEGKQRKTSHFSSFLWAFKSFLQFDLEHFLSMRGNLHDVIWTSRHPSYFFWSRFSFLQLRLWPMTPPPPSPPAGSSPHHPPSSSFFAPHSILRPLLCVLLCSVAPSHLSFLHLPATNHNLFTSPRAHSTTLLAPIADLFIPDNAEGWRLWFETRFAECISHGLTAWAQHSLGLIDVTLSRAELLRAASVKWSFFLKKKNHAKRWQKKRRYSAQHFTANLAAGRDERQQVAHLLMGENSRVPLPDWSPRVGLVSIKLTLLSLSAALN